MLQALRQDSFAPAVHAPHAPGNTLSPDHYDSEAEDDIPDAVKAQLEPLREALKDVIQHQMQQEADKLQLGRLRSDLLKLECNIRATEVKLQHCSELHDELLSRTGLDSTFMTHLLAQTAEHKLAVVLEVAELRQQQDKVQQQLNTGSGGLQALQGRLIRYLMGLGGTAVSNPFIHECDSSDDVNAAVAMLHSALQDICQEQKQQEAARLGIGALQVELLTLEAQIQSAQSNVEAAVQAICNAAHAMRLKNCRSQCRGIRRVCSTFEACASRVVCQRTSEEW